MSSKSALYLRLELVWWLFTALVVALIFYPIYTKLEDYPFYWINGVYIVCIITLGRYIFLLPYTFLAYQQVLKVAIVLVSVPFVFYLIEGIHTFNEFIEYGNLEALTNKLPDSEQPGLQSYIRNEMMLFGVGSVISAVIFPFRLMFSIWRLRNRGKA